MDKFRIATVGAGYFSRFQYSAWSRLPDVQLAAICNRDKKAAQDIAQQHNIPNVYDDFEKMLDEIKPDLVDIITPPITHINYVKAAVKRRIPVICQKPFTPSYQEAQDLVAFIESTGGKVIIHENFRFQPWYLQIKNFLATGCLGKLYQITFALRPGDGQGPSAYLDRQPYFQQMEHFLIHETAIHLIDVFRYLFGEISSIYAQLQRLNPVIKGEDSGIILFTFNNGATGIFDGNRLADHCADNPRLTMGEMQIQGENGTLSLDGNAKLYFRAHGSTRKEQIDFKWENRDFGGDCVFNFQKHVIEHFKYNTPLVNTASEYLVNIHHVQAVYRSNLDGKRYMC